MIASKPLTITMDPEVPLTGAARVAYNAAIMDLHEAQRAGTAVASLLSTLYAEVARVAPQMDSASTPAAAKTDFADFRKAFDVVRVKFGVPPAIGGGFGGGGAAAAAAAAAAQANALGRVAAAKAAIQGVWETPSAAVMKQAADAKAALAAATTEAQTVLTRAKTLSTNLAKSNIKFSPSGS